MLIAGIPGPFKGAGTPARIGNAAVRNIVGQGIHIATGQQQGFSWASVAAAAIAAPIAHQISESVVGAETDPKPWAQNNPLAAGLAGSGIRSLTSNVARVVTGGGKLAWQAVAVSTVEGFVSERAAARLAQGGRAGAGRVGSGAADRVQISGLANPLDYSDNPQPSLTYTSYSDDGFGFRNASAGGAVVPLRGAGADVRFESLGSGLAAPYDALLPDFAQQPYLSFRAPDRFSLYRPGVGFWVEAEPALSFSERLSASIDRGIANLAQARDFVANPVLRQFLSARVHDFSILGGLAEGIAGIPDSIPGAIREGENVLEDGFNRLTVGLGNAGARVSGSSVVFRAGPPKSWFFTAADSEGLGSAALIATGGLVHHAFVVPAAHLLAGQTREFGKDLAPYVLGAAGRAARGFALGFSLAPEGGGAIYRPGLALLDHSALAIDAGNLVRTANSAGVGLRARVSNVGSSAEIRAANSAGGVTAGTATTTRTTGQLVQDIAERADAWGVRQGLGNGPVAGNLKHGYADALLTRYQRMYGDLGLTTEVRYTNGRLWQSGDPLKGSVRLDVVEGPLSNPTAIYDYKFGGAQLSPSRVTQIRSTAGVNSNVPILEVRP